MSRKSCWQRPPSPARPSATPPLTSHHSFIAAHAQFDNSTYVVLYDMGATNTWAALVEFSTFSTGKGALKKQTPQFVTRAVEWDAALGGQDFDVCLMDHFAQEFNAKHEKMLQGVDIRTVPKSMGKLRKEVSKTKETLSLTASVNAPCNVEAIYEDTDLRSSINPPKFHSLCAGLFERVAAPFERVLAKAADIGLGVDDIEAFELLGGATRIPRVVEELSKTLGGRELDRHLDSAEAVVFGTALHAANLSTTFRMRPFGLNDIATYPMSVSIEKAADEVAAGEDASASARLLLQDGDDDAGVPLSPFLPPLKIVPTKRVVSVPYSENDLVATLHYGEPDAIATLPPDVESPVAVSFNVSGVAELAAKYTVGSERLPESKFESANITKVKMHFGVDRSGLVSLTKAEALVEVVELVNVTIKPPKKKAAGKKKEKAAEKEEKAEAEAEPEAAEAEAGDVGKAEPEADLDAEATEGAASRRLLEDAAEESEAAAATEATAEAEEEGAAKTEEGEKAPEAPKWELKPKFKTFKPQLKVSTGPLQHVGLDAETMSAAKAHMQALNDADIEKQLTAAAKNNLESYAIETRSAMRDEDSGVFDVTSEEERDTFIEALTDAEDWLYMDGADEPSAAFKDRLGELRATGDAIFLRLSEREARPAALKAARKWIDKTKKNVGDWNSTKPYINATKAAALLEDVGGYEEWLTNVTEAQEAASALEAPVFLVKEVVSRREPLARRYERLKATPKPKPPKPKANATNATAEGEATGSDGAEAAAAEGEASTPEAEAGGAEAGGEAQAGAEGEAQAGADGAEEAPPAKEEEPAHDDELR